MNITIAILNSGKRIEIEGNSISTEEAHELIKKLLMSWGTDIEKDAILHDYYGMNRDEYEAVKIAGVKEFVCMSCDQHCHIRAEKSPEGQECLFRAIGIHRTKWLEVNNG